MDRIKSLNSDIEKLNSISNSVVSLIEKHTDEEKLFEELLIIFGATSKLIEIKRREMENLIKNKLNKEE